MPTRPSPAQARTLLQLYAQARGGVAPDRLWWPSVSGARARMVHTLAALAGVAPRARGGRLEVPWTPRRLNPRDDGPGFDGETLRVRVDARVIPDLKEAVLGLRGVTEEAFVLLEAIEAAAGVQPPSPLTRSPSPSPSPSPRPAWRQPSAPKPRTGGAKHLTREAIEAALRDHQGSMKAAAASLGVARSTLREAADRLGAREHAQTADADGTRLPSRAALLQALRESGWSAEGAARLLRAPRSSVRSAIARYGLSYEADLEAREAVAGYDPSDRRPNPPEAPPFDLWTQSPQPEQPWIHRGAYAELEGARDDATFYGRDPGTVVRITQGARESWLGVVDAHGAIRRAPRLPLGGRGVDDREWVSAWEGPQAEAPWMLNQCSNVDPRRLALAACACAEAAFPYLPRRGSAEVRSAVAAARAWGEGRGSLGAVVQAVRASDARPAPSSGARSETLRAMAAAWAYGAAENAARVASSHASPDALAQDAPRHCAVHAALYAGNALGAMGPDDGVRALAPVVRRYLSLGEVLFSMLFD